MLILAMAFTLIASGASAAILASDDFSYADGDLVPNGGWANHSGTGTFIQVESQEAVLVHGGGSREDANLAFTASPGGAVYFAFDFSVDDLGSPYVGTDNEYFAHFMPDTGYNYRARMDIVEPTGAGDFSVGLSTNGSSADVVWAADLTYGIDYHVIVCYDQDLAIAKLWIDATSYDDTSITGTDEDDPGEVCAKIALRQAGSSMNETIRIDNLVVADMCEDVFSADCPTVANENQTWGNVKALFR